ncbi:MAG: TVP38/TMEM64 family protein, partial [Opitutales bacterium]
MTSRHFLLAVGLAALGAGLFFAIRRSGVPEAVDALVLGLRKAGPVVFFATMAVLPAMGFPMLAFTLAAGPVFGPTLGAGWVIGWSLTAVVFNLLLTYWLAHRVLRPLVSRLLVWFGFPLPDQSADGAWQLTLIVRLTPGPPFWLQSYVLGLIRVPLAPYLVVSTLVMAGYIIALVCGGQAIIEGNGRMAFAAAGLLVVTVAALQLLRRVVRRRAAAALPLNPLPPIPIP